MDTKFSKENMIHRCMATQQEMKEFQDAGIYARYVSDDLSYLISDEEMEEIFQKTVLDIVTKTD